MTHLYLDDMEIRRHDLVKPQLKLLHLVNESMNSSHSEALIPQSCRNTWKELFCKLPASDIIA